MSRATLKLPPIQLLEQLYRDKALVHGLDHVLRVFLFAQLISKHYSGKIDMQAILLAALLHDLGRKRDFGDKFHGNRSGEWVEKYLALFVGEDVDTELVKTLCDRHAAPDAEMMTLELKILKDADALDRWRLLHGPNESFLRLPESRALMPITKKIVTDWRIRKLKTGNSQKTLRQVIKKYQLQAKIPKEWIDLKPLAKFSTDVQKADKLLKTWVKLCERTWKASNVGALTASFLNEIESNGKLIESGFKSDFVAKTVLKYAKKLLRHNFKPAIFGYSYEKAVRDKVKTIYNWTYEPVEVSKEPSFVLCAIVDKRNKNNLFKQAYINLLIDRAEAQKLSFINEKLFGEPKITGRLLNLLLLLRTDIDSWMWIYIVGLWIKSIKKACRAGQITEATVLTQFALKFYKKILKSHWLDMEDNAEIVKGLTELVQLARKYELPIAIAEIRDIWGGDFFATVKLFPKGSVLYYANVFNIYDKCSDAASDCVQSQFELSEQLARSGLNIDKLVEYYLLPIALSSYFGKHVEVSELFKFIIDKTIIERAKGLIKLKKKELEENGPEYQHILEFRDKVSAGNVDAILKQLGLYERKQEFLEEFSRSGVEYKLISNIPSVDVLREIVENESSILSLINVATTLDTGFRNNSNTTYERRTKYRDVVHRNIGIRFPNISNSHAVYGILEQEEKLKFNDQGKFNSVNFGSVVVVYKDKVKSRTVFTFLDSLWDFRSMILTATDAGLFKYLIDNYKLRVILKTGIFSTPIMYTEAMILGEVRLDDVEAIVVSKAEYDKGKSDIKIITGKFPHIKIVVREVR